MSDIRRRRILFVAEGVSLAHVTRPLVLARALDTKFFEIDFACATGYETMLTNLPARLWSIKSISSKQFLESLAKGHPIYDSATLHSYVDEDLQLLEDTHPDLVIGDFRLSLSVSATRLGIPYASITNAYWSEYSALKYYPVPELPVTRILGVLLTDAVFQHIQPWVFAYHARALNRVRKDYGMPPLSNLLQTYTESDHVLYADLPNLFPSLTLPQNHHYLGPIIWSPDIGMPSWWHEVDSTRPIVYVNLGSSGAIHVIPTISDALSSLRVSVVFATAGRLKSTVWPSNMRVAELLPGDRVARQATVVVCNGGSPSVYQALQEGTPVIGIPSNMDQHLMMRAIVREGAGLVIRSEHANKKNIQEAIVEIVESDSYRERARTLQKQISEYLATNRFAALVAKLTTPPSQEFLGASH